MKLSEINAKLGERIRNTTWLELAKEMLEKQKTKEKKNFSSRNSILELIRKLEGQKRNSILAQKLRRRLTVRPEKKRRKNGSSSGPKS